MLNIKIHFIRLKYTFYVYIVVHFKRWALTRGRILNRYLVYTNIIKISIVFFVIFYRVKHLFDRKEERRNIPLTRLNKVILLKILHGKVAYPLLIQSTTTQCVNYLVSKFLSTKS